MALDVNTNGGGPTTQALPVSATTDTSASVNAPGPNLPIDAANIKKPFVVSATLREEYDDNIYTSSTDKVSSLKTDFGISVLGDLPMDQSDLSAVYTFGGSFFYNRPGSSFDTSHDFLVRYNRRINERFTIDFRDDFSYSDEPNLLDSIGTVNRDGGFFSNQASIEAAYQWTPLISTTTSYSNVYVDYDTSSVATEQNSDTNTVAQDIRFAIWPKYTLVFGGIFNNVSYEDINRGFSSYTGDVGVDWQALPSLSFGVRGGGTYLTPDQGQDSASPYASLTANWHIGAKSTLSFAYTHSIQSTDVVFAQAQQSDQVSGNFLYQVNPDITVNFEGIYTHSGYDSDLLTPGTIGTGDEDIIGFSSGGQYAINKYLSLEAGYNFSYVSSTYNFRDYTRDQLFFGVRGTY